MSIRVRYVVVLPGAFAAVPQTSSQESATNPILLKQGEPYVIPLCWDLAIDLHEGQLAVRRAGLHCLRLTRVFSDRRRGAVGLFSEVA